VVSALSAASLSLVVAIITIMLCLSGPAGLSVPEVAHALYRKSKISYIEGALKYQLLSS
jgi:hypothetical protein